MRMIKIAAGVVCLAVAIWPAMLVFGMLKHFILPAIGGSSNLHVHDTVGICGYQFSRGEVNILTLVAAIATFAMVFGGLFLISSKANDGA